MNSKPTNVRFHPRDLDRLSRLADKLNLDVSDLVRAAVAAKLPEWEKNGVTFRPPKGRKEKANA